MKTSFIHLYCGDGKGKTTAAMGLALRALGQGKSVCCVQFLKNGQSGEIKALQSFERFTYSCAKDMDKFVFQMNEKEKENCRLACGALLAQANAGLQECDVLILDEICAAVALKMVDEQDLLTLLDQAPSNKDIVLTGRDPSGALLERADYISEIHAVRHPYDKGVAARAGIEF